MKHVFMVKIIPTQKFEMGPFAYHPFVENDYINSIKDTKVSKQSTKCATFKLITQYKDRDGQISKLVIL
jgi:hypothetical protein